MKVELIGYMGSDLDVVNAARVSFDKESKWEYDNVKESYDLSVKDQKLIKYLAEHKHYSPFGHCFASFRCKAPVFCHRQLVKHEYLRCNEVSRRYVDDAPEFYTPEVWRGRSKDKKQGSDGVVEVPVDTWRLFEHNLDTYQHLLSLGVAPEQARMVLPLNTYTTWIWSGSLDAFANMYNLRSKPDAQEETRQIALMIGKEMETVFPHSWKALVA